MEAALAELGVEEEDQEDIDFEAKEGLQLSPYVSFAPLIMP